MLTFPLSKTLYWTNWKNANHDVFVDLCFQSFPENPTVACGSHVGEDRVLEDGLHGVWVRGSACTRGDSEESVLRIDGAEFALLVESHPGDVVAHALDLVTRQGRLHHGQIRLSTGAGERGGDVTLFTFWIRDTQYLEKATDTEPLRRVTNVDARRNDWKEV